MPLCQLIKEISNKYRNEQFKTRAIRIVLKSSTTRRPVQSICTSAKTCWLDSSRTAIGHMYTTKWTSSEEYNEITGNINEQLKLSYSNWSKNKKENTSYQNGVSLAPQQWISWRLLGLTCHVTTCGCIFKKAWLKRWLPMQPLTQCVSWCIQIHIVTLGRRLTGSFTYLKIKASLKK